MLCLFQGELLNVTHECDSIIAITINMPIDEYALDDVNALHDGVRQYDEVHLQPQN